jgi:energy-coupling factor transporter ATP-binding protein EcfA2
MPTGMILRDGSQMVEMLSPIDTAEGPVVPPPEYEELLHSLDDKECRGVLLIGPAGSGKTTLLRLLMKHALRQGGYFCFAPLAESRGDRALGSLLDQAILGSRHIDAVGRARWVRSSAGEMSVAEAADVLQHANPTSGPRLLLLDGLDETPVPSRVGTEIDELSYHLRGDWQLVVSSRPPPATRVGRHPGFRTIFLDRLTHADAHRLLTTVVPGLVPKNIERAIELSNGSPLFLRLIGEQLRASPDFEIEPDPSPTNYLRRLFGKVLDRSSDVAKLTMLIERLALATGPEPLELLAASVGMSVPDTRRLLSEAASFISWPDEGNVVIAHVTIREYILASRIFVEPFALADLSFGAEEAERDTLLEASYVPRPGLGSILDQGRTIVIGDRGSGKSAIFRRLHSDGRDGPDGKNVLVLPVADPHPFLYRIVVQGDAPATVEEYRAAWLLIVACVLASAMPQHAPKQLQRTARDLHAVFDSTRGGKSAASRLLHGLGGRLTGASLTLSVGPVNLGVKAPDGASRPSRSSLDIEEFLKSYDEYLVKSGKRVAVPIDRIDEMFKYEREKQEPLVQGLLQAESAISLLQKISVVVFLRTDLFEIYNVQEKNKLVSRTLILEWSEEDWLRLLVNRVFATPQAEKLARTLGAAGGGQDIEDIPGAFDVLFPEEIEEQPVQSWLIESVRNGNGSISPRLVVLLLLLARDLSQPKGAIVSSLPLFSVQALRDAMTRLSNLSYSEIVDDFKVAKAFVLNCRAGKLREFELSAVEALFEPEDGPVSEQVRLLERLGFLERIVRHEGDKNKQLFRIPALYTRSWDHS